MDAIMAGIRPTAAVASTSATTVVVLDRSSTIRQITQKINGKAKKSSEEWFRDCNAFVKGIPSEKLEDFLRFAGKYHFDGEHKKQAEKDKAKNAERKERVGWAKEGADMARIDKAVAMYDALCNATKLGNAMKARKHSVLACSEFQALATQIWQVVDTYNVTRGGWIHAPLFSARPKMVDSVKAYQFRMFPVFAFMQLEHSGPFQAVPAKEADFIATLKAEADKEKEKEKEPEAPRTARALPAAAILTEIAAEYQAIRMEEGFPTAIEIKTFDVKGSRIIFPMVKPEARGDRKLWAWCISHGDPMEPTMLMQSSEYRQIRAEKMGRDTNHRTKITPETGALFTAVEVACSAYASTVCKWAGHDNVVLKSYSKTDANWDLYKRCFSALDKTYKEYRYRLGGEGGGAANIQGAYHPAVADGGLLM